MSGSNYNANADEDQSVEETPEVDMKHLGGDGYDDTEEMEYPSATFDEPQDTQPPSTKEERLRREEQAEAATSASEPEGGESDEPEGDEPEADPETASDDDESADDGDSGDGAEAEDDVTLVVLKLTSSF